MTKELAKYKTKSKRKPEYTKEGMAILEKTGKANQGRIGEPVNPVITGARKRGHGRGKASDAGPSKRRAA
jgi:hypothetical protein